MNKRCRLENLLFFMEFFFNGIVNGCVYALTLLLGRDVFRDS